MKKLIIGLILIGILIYSLINDRLNSPIYSKHEYDIIAAEVKAEKIMKTDESVRAIASSFDGKDLIKFRIVVKKKIDNSEAKRLIGKLMNEIAIYANARNSVAFWTKFNINFDIIDENDGQVLYQGLNNKKDGGVYWIF
ncbi:hypothetical protein O9H85_21575 [Paenibacillus filicis]|uniref:Uncharacterized protein n=1 Tax=Paenibacillus gyeongsangnamensis TaxID=3388067 RepID=A0ABT4QDN5_9BACL|nr:hypothetical protein [Paenibacillus filicis]MCZ8514964.1 hypothetical protein [Paenibacillus filicis]